MGEWKEYSTENEGKKTTEKSDKWRRREGENEEEKKLRGGKQWGKDEKIKK